MSGKFRVDDTNLLDDSVLTPKILDDAVNREKLHPDVDRRYLFMTLIENSALTVFETKDVPVLVKGDLFKEEDARAFTCDVDTGKISYMGSTPATCKMDCRFSATKTGADRDASFYFAIGSDDDNDITEFADAGGGDVTVTTENAHVLSSGTRVLITGTTSYNGVFTIANASASVFDITVTWVSDDATGNWALVKEGSVAPREVDTGTSSINLLFFTTFVQGDYSYMLAEGNGNPPGSLIVSKLQLVIDEI